MPLSALLARIKTHRRHAEQARAELKANAEKALAAKTRGKAEPVPPHHTAREGMRSIENKDQAPSGAFEHAGNTPKLKRSRVARSGDT